MKKKATKQGRTWAVKNTNPDRRAPYTIIMEEHFHGDLPEGKKKPAAKKRTAPAKRRPAAAVAPRKRATPAKAKPTAAAKKKPAQVALKDGPFSGATEISMTANKISVTKKVSANKNGRFEQHEVRTYHDKTPANMRALQSAIQSGNAKKVTVKFK